MPKRSIYLNRELDDELRGPLGERINISEVCRMALLAEVRRLRAEDQPAAEAV